MNNKTKYNANLPLRSKDLKETHDIIIRFPNAEAAAHFSTWLCEAGEQDYWESMEYRQEEEPNELIVAHNFTYPPWKQKETPFIIDTEVWID